MSATDDLDILDRVIRWINFAQEHRSGLDFRQFSEDQKTLHSVAFCLVQIGSELNELSPETRMAYQNIPWRNLIRLRNTISHEYPGVTEKSVWKVAFDDLPALKPKFEMMVRDISIKSGFTSEE
jgi:uncharacterized protein with HEPN domain